MGVGADGRGGGWGPGTPSTSHPLLQSEGGFHLPPPTEPPTSHLCMCGRDWLWAYWVAYAGPPVGGPSGQLRGFKILP